MRIYWFVMFLIAVNFSTSISVDKFSIRALKKNNQSIDYLNTVELVENEHFPLLVFQNRTTNRKIELFLADYNSLTRNIDLLEFTLTYSNSSQNTSSSVLSFQVKDSLLYDILSIRLLHLFKNEYYGGKRTKIDIDEIVTISNFTQIVNISAFQEIFQTNNLKCGYYALFMYSHLNKKTGIFDYKYHYSIGIGGGRLTKNRICLDKQFKIVDQGFFIDDSTCSIPIKSYNSQVLDEKESSDDFDPINLTSLEKRKRRKKRRKGHKKNTWIELEILMINPHDSISSCFVRSKKEVLA